MRAKFSKVLTVTAYADRTGQPNVFVLFEDCDAASKALEVLRPPRRTSQMCLLLRPRVPGSISPCL